mmetsp:Transcript_28300/g.67275  ORF Transcript_28300/g.67275 Transcript_28300/m.67275 type:complete len:455 (-) Transcript_28300:91-1455(-)
MTWLAAAVQGCCGLGGCKVHCGESPDDCSPDFWNNYEDDIRLVKSLGSNCFRFSFEWGRLEPERGMWDESAFERYSDILDCLERHGIQPCATLHHFVHPWWFESIGGFDEVKNLELFVGYCKKVFERFGGRIRLWLTINEVAVVPYTGYIYGNHPPGKPGNFHKAGILYRNLLIAHAMVYKALKAMPHGKHAKIGIVHDWLVFEPKGKGLKYAHIRPIANVMNRSWGNDQFIEWFKHGTFTWKPHSLTREVRYEAQELPGLDWVGLNYYSRAVLSCKFAPVCHDGEIMTEMPYGIYPEGMYLAIQYCCQLDVPVYITETGLSNRSGESQEFLIRSYFNEVKRAVKDGYDVRGVMYWTLVDNFEWAYGFTKHFGLYEWDKATNARIPRTGVAVIRECFKDLKLVVPRIRDSWSSPTLIGAATVSEMDDSVREDEIALAEMPASRWRSSGLAVAPC